MAIDYGALEDMYNQAGRLQLMEIENRYNLGRAQLSNQWKIASLQASVSREQIAAQREYQRGLLKQAKEEMERIGIPDMLTRRFVAEKNYEIAKGELTLKVAAFGAELGSTPDRYFQARRFQALDAPRLLGQDTSTAVVPGAPVPQVATLEARLTGQDPAGVIAPPPPPPTAPAAPATAEQPPAPSAAAPYGGSAPATAGDTVPTGPDAGRVAQQPPPSQVDPSRTVAAIARAVPASPYAGLNETDTAALKLIESIYKQGAQALPRGELERLAANGRIGFMRSGGALLGYDPAEFESAYAGLQPLQGNARLA